MDFQSRYAMVNSPTSMDAVVTNVQLVFILKKCSHSVDCLSMWFQARDLFRVTLLKVFPKCYGKLVFYKQFIGRLIKKFIRLAVMAYNVRFHSKCMVFNCTLNVIDNGLFITVLDATAIEASAHQCFHCSNILP